MLKKILFLSLFLFAYNSFAVTGQDSLNKLNISGKVIDSYNKLISDAELDVSIDGKYYKTEKTSSDGSFIIQIDSLQSLNNIEIKTSKPTYRNNKLEIEKSQLAYKEGTYSLFSNITIDHILGPAFYISVIILLLVYILIGFDLCHRTLAASLGAALILLITYTFGSFNKGYFIISFEDAMKFIDLNVVFLLFGMMIIVGIMKITGVFQWLAYKSYRLAKGNIWILVVLLTVITAIASAFLDNVTTMLLIAPVTIEIAVVLGINPFSFLLPEILASNIGGTATIIGDPPNIMIGSYAGLTFNQFVVHLAPIVIVCMFVLIFMMKFYFGKEYAKAKIDNVDELLKKLKEEYKITDSQLLKKSLIVLGIVILMFITHGFLHMEVSIAALVGASLLLLISKVNIVDILEKEVEWPTLVFFMMLFIVVGAAESTGLIQMIANSVSKMSGGNITTAILLIIWVSAIASSIVDNIPFTATMLPVVGYLTHTIPGAGNTLWWALALGACLGGNGTLVGASANIVTAGLAEKRGYKITFFNYLKVCAPITIATLVVSSILLLLLK
ncbi:MAG: ArsB/NhaD family transporter [bacterium]|nr:ArsB/NhaD family transporter [bacterium]